MRRKPHPLRTRNGYFGFPADCTQVRSFGRQTSISLDTRRHKARSACLQNASQAAFSKSHILRYQCFRKCHSKSKKMITCNRTKPTIMGTIRNRDFQTCGACNRV